MNGHYINNRDKYLDSEVITSVDTLDVLRLLTLERHDDDAPTLGLRCADGAEQKGQDQPAQHQIDEREVH